MSFLMAFVTDHITSHEITSEALNTYMKRHGSAYKWTDTTDSPRVEVKADDIVQFYTTTLPEAVNGTRPSLVFNMDEMDAEMFADRKRVYVFVRRSRTTQNTSPTVGVPRSTRDARSLGAFPLMGRCSVPPSSPRPRQSARRSLPKAATHHTA